MLTRYADWPERLSQFIEAVRHKPFSWGGKNGGHDCGLFAADVIQEMTGVDPAAELRGYDDALGARRALEKQGASDVARFAGILFGNSVPPAMARRGDLVGVETEHGIALGICLGERTAFAGINGLEFVPTLKCVQAWWVG